MRSVLNSAKPAECMQYDVRCGAQSDLKCGVQSEVRCDRVIGASCDRSANPYISHINQHSEEPVRVFFFYATMTEKNFVRRESQMTSSE